MPNVMKHASLLLLMLSTIIGLIAVAEEGAGGAAEPGPSSSQPLPPAFPGWPDRYIREDYVPPPPLGPYMSTALSGMNRFPDSGGPGFEDVDPEMNSPFFKREMPWPEARNAPERWEPESGEYHYVPDEIVERLEQRGRDRQSRGYRGRQMPTFRQPRRYEGGYRGGW